MCGGGRFRILLDIRMGALFDGESEPDEIDEIKFKKERYFECVYICVQYW